MTRFADLLRYDGRRSVAEQQEAAGRRFPDLIARSPLTWWRPGDPIATEGRRLLIGVAASYSLLDLQLLDALVEEEPQSRRARPRIDVFDIEACPTMADFESYVPGIGRVYQTPVAGLWEDGILKQKAWGSSARDLIGVCCELEPQIRQLVERHYRALQDLAR